MHGDEEAALAQRDNPLTPLCRKGNIDVAVYF
jgi:hypothetical protein